MNAIMLSFRAFFVELEELAKTILLGTNYHKMANLKIIEQQAEYFEEQKGMQFNPKTLELTFTEE